MLITAQSTEEQRDSRRDYYISVVGALGSKLHTLELLKISLRERRHILTLSGGWTPTCRAFFFFYICGVSIVCIYFQVIDIMKDSCTPLAGTINIHMDGQIRFLSSSDLRRLKGRISVWVSVSSQRGSV